MNWFSFFSMACVPSRLIVSQFFSGSFLFMFKNFFSGTDVGGNVLNIVFLLFALAFIGALVIICFTFVEKMQARNIENNKLASRTSVSPPTISNSTRELDDKIKEKENLIEELNIKIKSLEDKVETLENENDYLHKYVENYKRGSSSISKKEIDKVGTQISDSSPKEIINSVNLTVIEGPLVEAGPEHAVYYKAWREKGVLYFVFDINENTKRAINNRTSIIEPFCEKSVSSKSPEESESVLCKEPGILYDDYSVKKKVQIEYK